ncbi:MAG: hypothetical protein U1F57_08255 [bacterium]
MTEYRFQLSSLSSVVVEDRNEDHRFNEGDGLRLETLAHGPSASPTPASSTVIDPSDPALKILSANLGVKSLGMIRNLGPAAEFSRLLQKATSRAHLDPREKLRQPLNMHDEAAFHALLQAPDPDLLAEGQGESMISYLQPALEQARLAGIPVQLSFNRFLMGLCGCLSLYSHAAKAVRHFSEIQTLETWMDRESIPYDRAAVEERTQSFAAQEIVHNVELWDEQQSHPETSLSVERSIVRGAGRPFDILQKMEHLHYLAQIASSLGPENEVLRMRFDLHRNRVVGSLLRIIREDDASGETASPEYQQSLREMRDHLGDDALPGSMIRETPTWRLRDFLNPFIRDVQSF